MKLFLQILAGILIAFIILIIGLNIYFTDERLKNMIMPHVNQALEREVQVDQMSLTFFRTFPRFGIHLEGFLMPDDEGEPIASFETLTTSIRLTPLFRNEIAITNLEVVRPNIYYTVYADSTTNIDFLMDDEDAETEPPDQLYSIEIPRFVIQNAGIFYSDATTQTRIDMEGLDAEIGLQFADLIESRVDATLNSLSANIGGTQYLSNLSLQLQQTSTIDMQEEILTLSEGIFTIRGLALNLAGSFGKWSSDEPQIDLQFSSTSDNFGELLRLAPPDYDDLLKGLETRGSLTLEGSITGVLIEDEIPDFRLLAEVADGYLQNPDLQEPIREIFFSLQGNKERLELSNFSAEAAGNTVEASGVLDRPFDEDAIFTARLFGDVDLETISQFYPIDEQGVETLAGLLAIDLDAAGHLNNPENATFNGMASLRNGIFKYIDVPRPIENIEADIEADENRIIINNASFRAVNNRFSMAGTITEPLSDLPTFNLDAELDFDLASIKEFYPIDEDTLTLRGDLTARASLRGQADQLARALHDSHIELKDGYFSHSIVARPLEDITMVANASSSQLNILEGRFRTGENRLSITGTIDNYLDEEPLFNVTLDGFATLADASVYYSLEPWISELSGTAQMNLNASGPAGVPTEIALNGSLELDQVNAVGDSLFLPVSNLRGILSVQPDAMTLSSFFMNYGTSDISLEGRLQNYLGFLEEHESEATMPSISGNYHSRMLNMDEMFDWDEETADEEPLPIYLPQMTSTVAAQIDTLIIFSVPIYNIIGSGRINPERILIDEATAELFNGSAEGRLEWNVPQPDYTNLRFVGNLNELQVNAFFREFPILGENSRFEQHVTGEFSGNADYYTELDEFVDPVITSTRAEGSFGMTRARLRGHPVQEQLADWIGADELRSLALDEWTANYTIRESVLTLNNFRLTSDNIGIELDGTQHLVTDEIDFTAQLLLPPRFRRGIASVISSQAVDAMTNQDGIIVVPIRITGTMENPRISPRQSIIEDLLRDTGRDVLRRLFDRN